MAPGCIDACSPTLRDLQITLAVIGGLGGGHLQASWLGQLEKKLLVLIPPAFISWSIQALFDLLSRCRTLLKKRKQERNSTELLFDHCKILPDNAVPENPLRDSAFPEKALQDKIHPDKAFQTRRSQTSPSQTRTSQAISTPTVVVANVVESAKTVNIEPSPDNYPTIALGIGLTGLCALYAVLCGAKSKRKRSFVR